MKYIFLILLFTPFMGCDIFNTREAETPDQPRSNFQLPLTPDQLLDNFINAYKEKNLQNYLSCFSDSSFTKKTFQFIPSSGAVSIYPSYENGWNRKDEEQYFNNLKSKVSPNLPITVVFNNGVSIQQGDSLIYSAGYSVSVPFEESNIPLFYQGELKFYLSRDSRLVWVITTWQDIKNTQDPSWSDLKGRLY